MALELVSEALGVGTEVTLVHLGAEMRATLATPAHSITTEDSSMSEASWIDPPRYPPALSKGALDIRLSTPGPLEWLTVDLNAGMARCAPNGKLAGYDPCPARAAAVGYQIAADCPLLVGVTAQVQPDGGRRNGT